MYDEDEGYYEPEYIEFSPDEEEEEDDECYRCNGCKTCLGTEW